MQQLRPTTDSATAQQCARELLDTLPPVVWFIRREIRGYRKELSLAQLRTLALVYRQPGASLSEVSEFLGSSLPTASRIVQGLVEQHLLARQGCPGDRRQLSLAITPTGSTVLTSAWAVAQERLGRKIESLSTADRQSVTQAMHLMKKIFGALGVPDEEAAPGGGANGNGNGNGRAERSAALETRPVLAQA